MGYTNQKLMALLTRFLLVSGYCISAHALAADPVCDGSNGASSACSEPELGSWDTFRFVLKDKPGTAKATEAEAIEDAVATLTRAFPCGLSYTMVVAPFNESGKILNWTAKEDAARIPYVGFASGANGNCQAATPESTGTVLIRRERRVRCARGYGWLMRDNMPTVCVRD